MDMMTRRDVSEVPGPGEVRAFYSYSLNFRLGKPPLADTPSVS